MKSTSSGKSLGLILDWTRKMPTLRQARKMLLLAYVDQVIDDHEFVLLSDVNEEKKSGIS